MSDRVAIANIIESAIQTANIDLPDTGDGTVRDQVYRSNEDSGAMAENVLRKLDAAGYEIRKKA